MEEQKIKLWKLTHLAFQLNYLLDRGYYNFSIQEMKERIEDRSLFNWLQQRCADDYFYLTALEENDRDQLLDDFGRMVNAVDEHRKMKIQNNGLCLLLAYVIELIQRHHRERGRNGKENTAMF